MFDWLKWQFWNIIGKRAVDKLPTKNKSMLITPEQLQRIATTMKDGFAIEMADLINELCPKYGIVDPLPFKMFLANCVQESLEFTYKSENMNYSAKRIVALFPARFPTLADALPFERKPKEFANKLYGGRYGNRPGTDDGWICRGGGFIGLTFRDTWQKYADYKKMSLEDASDYARETDEGALDSACWFFAVLKNLIALSKKGDFKAVVKAINGGYIGLDVRQKYYDKIQQTLK